MVRTIGLFTIVYSQIMSQVSRHKVTPELMDRLTQVLIEVLGATNNTRSGLLFTNLLLTSVERIMLAKRVAIALLIRRGYTYDFVMNTLNVSKGTVARIAEIIKTNDTKSLETIDRLIRAKQVSATLGKLEYQMNLLLPPKGRNWSTWRSNLEKKTDN